MAEPSILEAAVAEYLSVCNNASEGNSSTLTTLIWTPEDRTSALLTSAFSLLFLLLGLPLNLLVLLTILHQRLYMQPTTLLLMNLVISDLTLLLLVMPFQIVIGVANEFVFGSTDLVRCRMCTASDMLTTLFVLSSLFTIAMMSLDRFLFIYRPLHYNRLFTPLRAAVLVAVSWLVSVLVALPPAFGFGDVVFDRNFGLCLIPESLDYLLLVFVVVVLLVAAIVFCNVWVAYIVCRNIRRIYKVQRSFSTDAERKAGDQMRKKRHQKQLYALRVFGGLICSNVILWLPLFLLAIYGATLVTVFILPNVLYACVFVVFYSQALVHPLLETLLLSDIREQIKRRLLCCCCPKGKGHGCGCGMLTLCTAAVLPEGDSNDNGYTQNTSEAIL